MSTDDADTTVKTTWFLKSEENELMGQVYRAGDEAVPTAGAGITNGAAWGNAEIVRFSELGPTCAMRRFEVIIRVVGCKAVSKSDS